MKIKEEIAQYIADNFLAADSDGKLSDELSFMDSGLIDSTGIMEVIEFLESRYEITIADEEMLPQNLDSISNISSFVQRKLDR